MGTRHLIAIAKDNEYKLAQYGQWDGYPSGQGVSILDFLHNMDRPSFEEKVRALSFISDEELRQRWMDAGADPDSQWVNMSVSNLFDSRYPENSRETGAKILNIIQETNDRPLLVSNSIDFASDSLFCEFAYVIDFDKNTFEVYKGFNKSPLDESERFFSLTAEDKEREFPDARYYPVKLLKAYGLSNLPTEDDFIKELDDLIATQEIA